MQFNFLKNKSLQNLIILFASIFIGGFAGYHWPNFLISLSWLGQVFMNYLMLLVLPLIFLALLNALTSQNDMQKLTQFGKFAIIIILLNVILATGIGLGFGLIFKPGLGIAPSLLMDNDHLNMLHHANNLSFFSFITGVFPANLLDSAEKSQILPIVIFSVFFSIFAIKLKSKNGVLTFISMCAGAKEIILGMIAFVMKFAPIAVFSLIGSAIASSVLKGHFSQDMLGLMKFVFVFFGGCVLLCILQFLILMLIMGKKTFHFLYFSLSSSATGFATSSSMAALPVMLLNANSLELEDTLAKFMLPLAVVFNLGSSALYVACATCFVTQILQIHLSVLSIVLIYCTTVLTGLGTTGIPNAGFIATITVLKTLSLPASSVGILFPLDAILSRIRTGVNIWGHLFCVRIVQYLISKEKFKV